MTERASSRVVVAVNPHASFGKNSQAGQLAAKELVSHGFRVEVLQEDSYERLSQSIAEALIEPAFALVMVGGDGMIHLGLEHALRADLPLGVIPSGTGNDFARHLGIPLDTVANAVAHFVAATTTPPIRVDVGVATSASGEPKAYACVASAGFDAIVNQRANSLKFPKGRHRYTLALLIELAKLRPRHYTVTLDGADLSGEYMLVAVANSQSFGGGMKVVPTASLNDGLLDVLLVKPLSRWEFLLIYPRVFRGTHVTDRRVIIRQATTVLLDAEGIVAYADGEPVGSLPLSVGVSGAALSVFA
jgi:diacylglycerol kinase (ATP)